MADKDAMGDIKLMANLPEVVGIAVQGGVSARIIGAQVRAAAADVIEQDDAISVSEGRPDEAPHVLVAAETVGEHHRPTTLGAARAHVPAGDRIHAAQVRRRHPRGTR